MSKSELEQNKNNVKPSEDNLKLPVMFQKIKEYDTEDTRFTSVKIWLCHVGRNHNNSSFTKESIERAIPTLANTPILGYIEDNSNDVADYSDHRAELDVENTAFKYIGKAYGTIPENNNAKFEKRLCDDGAEREYLTVEGLLWNKWDESIDIMNRDVVKKQSMELHEDAYGHIDDNGVFVFDEFKFFGACILGADVMPAMESSTIELTSIEEAQFTAEDYKLDKNLIDKEIDSKMNEFNKHFSVEKSNERSGNENMSKKVEDAITEEVVTEEVIEEVKDFADGDGAATPKKDDKKEEKKDDKGGSEVEKLKEENAKLKGQITELKAEIKELKGSNDKFTKAEREIAEAELFAKYTELEGIEEYTVLKATADKFEDLNALEKEIAMVFVKNKANISFTKVTDAKEETSVKFDKIDTESDAYGGLLNVIKK